MAETSKTSINEQMLARKTLSKITTGNVKVKKKGISSKIVGLFFPEDKETVKQYIIQDRIIPGLKSFALDALSIALNGKPTPKAPTNGTYFAYNRMTPTAQNIYGKPAGAYSPRLEQHDYNTIAFETRGDAEGVLFAMKQQIKEYSKVSVADMYELVGLDCEFTDYKYGWYDLENAYAVRTKDGYVLSLPHAVVLD